MTIMNNAKKYKPTQQIKGVLVQEMVKSAKEIILGAKQDPLFGPVSYGWSWWYLC